MALRKIIHIDMDAFYASIEQRDNPKLKGFPVAVGHPGERGVVAAASYEARRYGVRSAMSSKMALTKCPKLIFVPARFEAYKTVSRQIMDIFLDYTDLVEPLSLDEAYLDVTVNHKNMPSATIIAKEIKQRIKNETGLTASAGVSINKFLAKIASDYNKPDGLFVITEKEAEAFVENLKIEQFWGVGKITADKMHRLGVHNGADLKRFKENDLVSIFGKAGHIYFWNARAIDNREVEPDRIRKSVGVENTFEKDIIDQNELLQRLNDVAEELWRRISKREFYGRTITLKIKYEDFEIITRRKTYNEFISDYDLFWSLSKDLLNTLDNFHKKIRLMGLSISNAYDVEVPKYFQLRFEFKE